MEEEKLYSDYDNFLDMILDIYSKTYSCSRNTIAEIAGFKHSSLSRALKPGRQFTPKTLLRIKKSLEISSRDFWRMVEDFYDS